MQGTAPPLQAQVMAAAAAAAAPAAVDGVGEASSRWRNVSWSFATAHGRVPSSVLERASHTATAVDNDIYVIGGRKG